MPSKTGTDIVPTSSDAGQSPGGRSKNDVESLNLTEHVSRNLRLVQGVIQRELADEALLEQLPQGIRLVLLPTDDVALAHAKLDMAIELARRGEAVKLQIVPARVGSLNPS